MPLSTKKKIINRTFAGLEILGGAAEVIGGITFAGSITATGIGAGVGVGIGLGSAAVIAGLDHIGNGFSDMYTAKSSNPYFVDALSQVSPVLGEGIDLLVGVGVRSSTLFKTAKKGVNLGLSFGGERSVVLQEGLHHLDPKTIKFSQPNVGTHFSNGKSLSETINDLRSGTVSPHDLPPIQVVQKDGQLFTIDNRRLLAFNAAGIEKIPVEVVSLENSSVALRFGRRFNPIGGQGNYAVVINKVNRNAALELLEEYKQIKRSDYGF